MLVVKKPAGRSKERSGKDKEIFIKPRRKGNRAAGRRGETGGGV